MGNISFSVDERGVGVATLDMPGRPFNVFSEAMIDELDALVGEVDGRAQELTGVVFRSGKDAFMAGADLAMVEGFTTLRYRAEAGEIRTTFSRLSYLLRRLEQLPVTTVAAVNGLALGGGLELAMACHHRVAADNDKPCLGLPEVLLGLLPGAGGTQRLPRLTSPAFAARMLMDGKPVTPGVALDAGLVDEVVEPSTLDARALALAAEAGNGARWDDPRWQPPADTGGVLEGDDALDRLCRLGWVDNSANHLYPALAAIARCLLDGYGRNFDDAMEIEFDQFLGLMLDPVAGNMVRTSFLSKTAAPKRAGQRLGKAGSQPQRIGVICAGDVPPRIAKRFDCVEAGAVDLHFGLRQLPDGAQTGMAVEVRYAGHFDQVEAVEVAAPVGEVGAATLAVLNRLRVLPVVVNPEQSSPLHSMLVAMRDWVGENEANGPRAKRIAAAVDAGRLFSMLGIACGECADFSDNERKAGFEMLTCGAVAAARAYAGGAVAVPQDVDVLAVFGLGYPAWTGGPLNFLDGLARGEFGHVANAAAVSGTPFYTL